MLAHSQQSIRRLIVIQNYNIFHKLIILSLCIPVIMLAGCTSAAVSAAAEPTEIPTAAVPTAIPKSAEPSVKSEPKSEPASDSLQVTPTVEPQTENAAPSSSHTPIRADAELSAPDTGSGAHPVGFPKFLMHYHQRSICSHTNSYTRSHTHSYAHSCTHSGRFCRVKDRTGQGGLSDQFFQR